jgi:hypothetical protein
LRNLAGEAMRRTKFETLARRRNVAARFLRGDLQWEIALAFEVHPATISRDLDAIHREWLAEAVKDRGEWVAKLLAKIDETERQAWAGWAKSQENAETLRARMRGDHKETEKVTKGQAGDPRFLDLVLKCVEARAVIVGLYEDGAKGKDAATPLEVRLVRADDFYSNRERLDALEET